MNATRAGGRTAPWTVRTLARAAAVVGVAGLAACGGGGGQTGGGSGAAGRVVIAEGADMDKPNPLVYATAQDGMINEQLYRPMLAAVWEDGRLEYLTAEEHPLALVRSYEFFGPDSASIRYRMRSDVTWTDGRPVTAHDAAFTFEIRGLPEVAAPTQDHNREIREIVVEDDSTLVIHFRRRYAEVFYHTAGQIIPRHVYEGSDLSQIRSHPSLTDPVNHLVTNGPMRLSEWVRGQRVVLTPNPDFEPQPTIEQMVIRIIPEEATRMIELQTGNVDIAQVPFHYIDQIRATEGLRIEPQDKRSYEYIAYNPKAHDFFADRDIRRALGLALDRDGIIDALQLSEFAEVAGGPYAPIFSLLYDPEGQAPLPYDTAQASRILREKGWTRGPDGILQKDGRRFSFTLVTNAENRRRVDIGQIAESQWRRIGVEANLRTLEFNTLVERMTDRDFDARIGGWQVGLSADLFQTWGDPDSPSNYVSYDNPRVQELIGVATGQPTEEGAAGYWRQVASLIVADQPYTWLFYYDTPYAVSERLQGVKVDVVSPWGEVWNWRIES